jgi:chromosome segregation ATPase
LESQSALAARLEQLTGELEAAREAKAAQESGLVTEIKDLRAELKSLQDDDARLRDALDKAQNAVDEAVTDRDELRVGLSERERQFQDLKNELAQARTAEAERAGQLDELREQLRTIDIELDEERIKRDKLATEVANVNSRETEATSEHRQVIETLNGLVSQRDQKVHALEQRISELENGRGSASEQLAGLEEELKEEKECTVNLSEIANSRQEQITILEEKLEEAEERFEEANWRLGKASHFEKLVRKRRKLIKAVIAEYRAKAKANTALKAGLDGLRTFKASSEQNHQKLLARVDKLTGDLREAEDSLDKYQGETVTKDELAEATSQVANLEERLQAQVELIETLESDLKEAKASRSPQDVQAQQKLSAEVSRLQSELESRDQAIAKLESDADKQQKRVAKLRGSESETMRLKAVKEQDQSLIDSLHLEIDQLKSALGKSQAAQAHSQAQANASSTAADEGASADLKKQEHTIANLNRTLKEQEKEIAKLNESVAAWQKKYEFLSTEAPPAYQSVAEK